jgi:YbgC/YbaW family acyl-CoA thioester hydrolase
MFLTEKFVHFGDCDPGGIMFNANLLRYAHEAFEMFILSVSDYPEYYLNKKIAYPIMNTETRFAYPFFCGTYFDVELGISELKERSFEVTYYFFDKSKKLLAKAKTVHVALDLNTLEKTELPTKLSEKLKLHLMKQNQNK